MQSSCSGKCGKVFYRCQLIVDWSPATSMRNRWQSVTVALWGISSHCPFHHCPLPVPYPLQARHRPPATLSLTLVGSGRGTPIPCPPCLSHQGPSLIHLRSPRASLGVPRPPIDPCPLSLTMLIARYNYIFSSLNAARSLDLLCFLLVLLSPMVPPCAIRHPRSA
jgi:hypothetical protein